jgi:hypothetical protein
VTRLGDDNDDANARIPASSDPPMIAPSIDGAAANLITSHVSRWLDRFESRAWKPKPKPVMRRPTRRS